MAKPSLLSVCLCLLVLFHCCVAGNCKKESQQQQGECQIERLNAREPQRRIEAEAGYTEFWDSDDDQFQCAGVAACRNVINPQGLLLPSYTSAPALLYVLQGEGFQGIMIPGCPETFQSSQQSQEGQSRRFQDQHQKIRNLREGDVIALPAGIAHWCYNNGERDLVLLIIEDTSNDHNQLDNNPRKFFLAGNPQQSQQQQQQKKQQNQGNVLAGMDVDTLAEVFRVDRETASRLQGQDDRRGHIVRAESDLQVIRPQRTRDEQEREERGYEGRHNGLEETICSARLRQNIDDPSRADFFNPRAGCLTILNSLTLPILSFLQLSAERGVLYRAIQHAHSFSMQSFQNRKELVEKKREVVGLQKTVKSLQSKMKTLEDQAEVAIKERDDAEEKVGSAEAINKVLQAQLKEAEDKVAQAEKELEDALATKAAEIKDADEKAYSQGMADVTEVYEKQVREACNKGFSLAWMTLLEKLKVPENSSLRNVNAIPLPFPPTPPLSESDTEDEKEEEGLVRKPQEAAGAKSPSLNGQVLDLTQENDGDEVVKEVTPEQGSSDVPQDGKSVDETLAEIDAEIAADKEADVSLQETSQVQT